MYWPRLTATNRFLIVLSVSVFLLTSILGLGKVTFLQHYLPLSVSGLLGGHIYQFITFPFLNSGLMELIFNSLLLWWIGSELENNWGRKRYLRFLSCSLIGSIAVFLLISWIGDLQVRLFRLATFSNALLVAYALTYPDRQLLFMLVIPLPAKYFCLILLAIQLYFGIFSSGFALAWGHLGGMFGAFIFLRRQSLFKNLGRKKQKSFKVIYGDKQTWH